MLYMREDVDLLTTITGACMLGTNGRRTRQLVGERVVRIR
jgi:hypothetical protein